MLQWFSRGVLCCVLRTCACLLAGATVPVAAIGAADQLDQPLPDVRILVDVSRSAVVADPDGLRGAAAASLARLLPEAGRGGIWVYDDTVSSLVEHGTTDRFWKQLVTLKTRSLEARSELSNLDAALRAATWDVAQGSELRRHVIVVGGGRQDTGDVEADAAVREQLLKNTVRQLETAGIRVHAVVLPGDTDSGLLRTIAERTKGLFAKVGSTADLGQAFETLLHRTATPPTLPVVNGGFLVEPGLEELTLWREGNEADLLLKDPAGQSLSRAAPGKGVRWHDARGYDVLTIDRPIPGRWQFEPGQSARVFALGQLALRVTDVPATLLPGFFNQVEFMLFAGVEAVKDDTFLATVEAEAELVGETQSVPQAVERLPGGVFRVGISDTVEGGAWTLEIRLSGMTFAREASIPFVLANPVRVWVRQVGADLVMYAELADASVDYATLAASSLVRMPPAPRQRVVAEPFPGGLWRFKVPDVRGNVEIGLNFSGRYRNQSPFELHTEVLKVTVPLAAEKVFRFDTKGKAIEGLEVVAAPKPAVTTAPGKPGPTTTAQAPDGDAVTDAGPAAAEGEHATAGSTGESTTVALAPERELPLWFAAAASVMNLLIAVGIGWFLSRRRLPEALQVWLDERAAAEEPAAA